MKDSAARVCLKGLVFLVAAGAYVFAPWTPVKFAGLVLAVWLPLAGAGAQVTRPLPVFVAVFAYSISFLLNPLCMAPFLRLPGVSQAGSAMFWQTVFGGFGFLWLRSAVGLSKPPVASPARLELWFIAPWLFLLVCLHSSAWDKDVSYGGDEHYHMAAAATYALLGKIIATSRPGAFLLVLWLVTGVFLAHRARSGVFGSGSRGGWVYWGAAGLVLCASIGLFVFVSVPALPEAIHVRAIRYPVAQAWLSGLIGLFTFQSWGRGEHVCFGVLRFVPMLALFGLGLFLASDTRWGAVRGRAQALVKVLAVLAVATTPTLLYHGTALYLELPVVVLLVVVMSDARRWLFATPGRLPSRHSWWAAILLGFTKETGIVVVLLLWMARLAVRTRRWWKRGRYEATGRQLGVLAREARLAFSVLGPGLLYLVLRLQHGARPYRPHWENLANGHLVLEALASPFLEFGAIWLLALLGAEVRAPRTRRFRLALGVFLFAGMCLFHLLDAPEWVGYARFNLLLLPPVLVMAWEGLTWLKRRGSFSIIAASLAVVAANLLTSPLDIMNGRRIAWGNSDERWYDFSACLEGIRRESPYCVIAIGGLEQPYAISQVTDRLGWRPVHSVQLAAYKGAPAQWLIEETLREARKESVDYVIFATTGAEPPIDAQSLGYQKARAYPGGAGGLIVFKKTLP